MTSNKWTIQWATCQGLHMDQFTNEQSARSAWTEQYLPQRQSMYWAELVNPEGEVVDHR